jgi:hypothetical protein
MVEQVKHVVKILADLAQQLAASSAGFYRVVALAGHGVEDDEVPPLSVR